MNIRIITRLDIKGPNLVKGIHLEGLRVMGDPQVFAEYYAGNGADELFYQDVVASLYGRNSLQEFIKKTAEKVFIPITVGGGVRTLDDIKNILRSGADKVAINTHAINHPEFIREASRIFGSSTIVVAIEAIKEPNGDYLCYTDNGREHTGIRVFDWVKRVEELGAGEIIITSVDKEGLGQGFDHQLIEQVCSITNLPVIAHGGAGCAEDIAQTATITKLSGISAASIFHFEFLSGVNSENYKATEGNTTFLKSGKTSFNNIRPEKIENVKSLLKNRGVNTRI